MGCDNMDSYKKFAGNYEKHNNKLKLAKLYAMLYSTEYFAPGALPIRFIAPPI